MKLYSINVLNVLLATSSTYAFLAPTTHRFQKGMEGASSYPSLVQPMQMPQLKTQTKLRLPSTKLQYTSSLPDSSDPCIILNIEPGSADLKQIKTAYRRMALKYHPDTRTSADATEGEKRAASDDFARINAAYAFLSGKSTDKPETTESERKLKKQRQQKANATSPYGSSYSRNASHHQISASHHQRVGVRTGQGFDMSGNYRTSPTGTASARATRVRSSTHAPSDRTQKDQQSIKKGFYSRVRTPVNAGQATGATSTRRNTGGGGAPSGGSASSTSERIHVQVPVNRDQANSAFSKGDNVKITGGSYSGQSGKVTKVYPTMVKVSILSTLDVLVESKHVRKRSNTNVDPYIAARIAKEANMKNKQSSTNTSYSANSVSSRTAHSNASSPTGTKNKNNASSKANKNWVDDIRGSSANKKSDRYGSSQDSTVANVSSSDVNIGSRNTKKNWVDNTRVSSANGTSVQSRPSQASAGVSDTSPIDTNGVKSNEKSRIPNKNWVEDIRGSSVKGKSDRSGSSRDSTVSSRSVSGVKIGARSTNKNWVDDIRGFVMKNNSIQPKSSQASAGVRAHSPFTAVKTDEKKSSTNSHSATAMKTDEKKSSTNSHSATAVKADEKKSSTNSHSATAVKADEKKSSINSPSATAVKINEKKSSINSPAVTVVKTDEKRSSINSPAATAVKINEKKSSINSPAATTVKTDEKKSSTHSPPATVVKTDETSRDTDEIWIGDIQGFVVNRKYGQSRSSSTYHTSNENAVRYKTSQVPGVVRSNSPTVTA